MRILGGLTMVLLMAGTTASAQQVRGFVTVGDTTNANNEHFPTIGGGAVVDLGTKWLSAGGEGETFFSWPYFAGRGTLFGQGSVPVAPNLRALVLGGGGFGEDAGPMFGGGLEFHPRGGRFGLRLTVEDYVDHSLRFDCQITGTGPCVTTTQVLEHRVAVRGGVTF